MAVSIKQLSEYCRTSPSTVSKALNGYSDISEETRRKVLEAVEKFGYRPSAIARGLKTGHTFNLGVVYSEYTGSGFTHSYFSPVLEAFKAEAEKAGYDITFISQGLRSTHLSDMSYLEHSRYRNVDGVCLVCCDFGEEQILQLLKSDMPAVTVDYPFPQRSCVASENREGMTALTEYVIAQGHRAIAYVYGSPSPATKDRLSSFSQVMRAAGLEVPAAYLIQSVYHNPSAVREAVRTLLDLRSRPSCILLPDDFAALGGMDAIAEAGLRIPDDISIAGFDGVRILQMCRPCLTTVAQDTARIGQEAARQLIRLIADPLAVAPPILKVPTRLLKGDTVAPYR